MNDSTQGKRKFYVIDCGNRTLLSHNNGFGRVIKPFKELYPDSVGSTEPKGEDYMHALADQYRGYATLVPILVIYRRKHARELLRLLKQDHPDWASAFSPKLVELGEFVRHRDPRPITSWRISYKSAPGNMQHMQGQTVQNGFRTRAKARAIAKIEAENMAPGYELEVLPNYGRI